MAYDTLKAEIRQYIQTNGQQEITGQILQNVLLDMVNAYPSLDGYATQQWVSNQLNDMATQTWVGQNFVQNSALNNYLPLSGGVMTGVISAGTLSTGGYSLGNTGLTFEYSYNGSARYAQRIIISSTNQAITFMARGGASTGTVITKDNITSGGFIVSGGTSSEFLKADGSLDSNTYLSSADLSGYATETWVGNNYLPLTGGTLTGGLNISDGSHGYAQLFVDEDGLNIMTGSLTGTQQLYTGSIYSDGTIEATGSITGFSFIKAGGTSSQFLKADGSVDSNTYLTSSAISDMATQTWVGQQGFLTSSSLSGYATETWVGNNYLPLTGGTLTGSLTVNEKVGIGTTSPTSKLEVAGTVTVNPSGDKTLRFGTDGYYYITRRSDGCFLIINETYNDFIIGNYDDGNYTYFCNDLGGGSIDSGYSQSSRTWNWYINNDGTTSFTSVTQTSDMNYKLVTGDVKMSIYNVANAPMFKFTWKDEQKPTGQHIGSAAQYWQTIVPELVSLGTEKNPKMGMQYDVIALASAITIAKTTVEHEQRIAELEKENALLKAKLNIN